MQVSGLVVTDTGGSGDSEEEPEPPSLRSPGGVDQVPGRLRLSAELRVAPPPPDLAASGIGAGGQGRAPQTALFPPSGFSPFLQAGGAILKICKYPSSDSWLGHPPSPRAAAGCFT